MLRKGSMNLKGVNENGPRVGERFVISVFVVMCMVTGTGCDECKSLLDCPSPQICTREGVCIDEPPPPPPPPCRLLDLDDPANSDVFDPEKGFLDGDDKWSCPLPVGIDLEAGRVGPEIIGVQGQRITVSGSLFQLKFATDAAQFGSNPMPEGSMLVYGIEDRSYFVKPIGGNPLPESLSVELFVRPFADSAIYDFYIGIDPGKGTPDLVKPVVFFHTDLQVIGVGSGDIQVNVSWDTIADVDLHVFDPSGEEVFYANPVAVSGGELDLDSNVGCGSSSDERNENIVWPTGSAIDGTYDVHVNLYATDCGFAQTNYRVVVIRALEIVEIVEGSLLSADASTESSGEFVTDVTWPP